MMKKLLCILPLFATLSGCIIPMNNTDGQTAPIIIQTPTPIINPVIIELQENPQNHQFFVCKIKPFTQTFQSEHKNRGQAKLNVQKQCLNQHHEMFCREKNIECTEYK